jgi:hypothetical protein
MLAMTLDVSSLPSLSEHVIAYRDEEAFRPCEPWHHVELTIGYQAGAAITTSPQHLGSGRDILSDYQPKTELGRKLLALRRAYLAAGGQLLSPAALDEELRSRRGGVSDV